MCINFLCGLIVTCSGIAAAIAVGSCGRHNSWPELVQCEGYHSIGDIKQPEQRSWKHLKIQNSQLEAVNTSDFFNFPQVFKLDIWKCRINRIANSSFSTLPWLQEIDISDNDILKIDKGWIHSYNSLTKMWFSRNTNVNMDSFLTDYLSDCSKLTHLFLQENQIRTLTRRDFVNLVSLKEINLNKNDIKVIEEDSFATLSSLQFLDLSDNRISDISLQTFRGLQSLVKLNLEQNKISEIVDFTFNLLKNLVELSISGNSLQHLRKDTIGTLRKLEKLWLNENDINEIDPFSFIGLTDLTELYLSGNNLKSLSADAFVGLEQLQILYLDKNSIVDIQPRVFAQLVFLRDLNLSYNSIEMVSHEPFSELNKNLFKISYSTNNIRYIQPQAFSNLPELFHLNLAHNEIKDLPYNLFSGIKKLNTLVLSHNLIELLNFEVPSLAVLKIDHNQISFIPKQWNIYKKLRDLSIEGNPWQCTCLIEILKDFRESNIEYVDEKYFDGKKPVCILVEQNRCVRDLDKVKSSGKVETYNAAIEIYNN